MENQITCYEAQLLPKVKVTRKLIEEIYCSPSSPRLEPVKLNPNRQDGSSAVLLRKLKARGHRVLILTQMIPILDILELFLNFHFLTYVRVNESGAHSWHYLESIKKFKQEKQFFCAIPSSHTPSTGVSHVDANTVVFCATDLDPLMDTKTKEWCDKIARWRYSHIQVTFTLRNSIDVLKSEIEGRCF
ncbi:unnamed protein product [Bubo scandiacus]